MSVLITLTIEADPAGLEKAGAAQPEVFAKTIEAGVAHGLIAHRFYGSGSRVLVVDEWPDEASFHAFFEGTPQIRDIMMSAGAKGEPEITVWSKLNVGDEYPR